MPANKLILAILSLVGVVLSLAEYVVLHRRRSFYTFVLEGERLVNGFPIPETARTEDRL